MTVVAAEATPALKPTTSTTSMARRGIRGQEETVGVDEEEEEVPSTLTSKRTKTAAKPTTTTTTTTTSMARRRTRCQEATMVEEKEAELVPTTLKSKRTKAASKVRGIFVF